METVARLLNERGLKATAQRIAIYHYLCGTDTHPNAETIYAALRPAYPSLSLATVYKTLDSLQKAGIVARLHTDEDSFRYDARITPHPHLSCVRCKAVLDMDPKLSDRLLKEAREETDCELYTGTIYFYGLCPNCRGKREETPSL